MKGFKIGVFDKVYDLVNVFFLTLVLAVFLYPMIYIISSSFSSPNAVVSGKVFLWPVEPSIIAYQYIFRIKEFWIGLGNSVFYTIAGTSISVVLTILAAYPLSRPKMRGRVIYALIFSFSMFFSGGIIPTYIVVKDLGMINKVWSMLLPTALSVWNVIITKTYYQQTIPNELYEAAELDGCNDFSTLRHVVLPLSGAITAVNFLYYSVARWNSYFEAFLYLTKQDMFPLQIVLRKLLVLGSFSSAMTGKDQIDVSTVMQSMKFALIVVSCIPILITYPFAEKYFVKGMMVGSIKG